MTDRSISKSFLCHHCVVLYTVYVFYVRTAPVRSQHVSPRCTLPNSRPRLLLRLPLPTPTPLKLALLAQLAPCLFSSSSSLLLLLLLLSTRGCRDSVWAPTEWLTARRNCMATINPAVESWQKGFNSFAYRSARLIFSWADGCSTRCDLFNLVPSCQVSRCQVSRFQSPRLHSSAVHGDWFRNFSMGEKWRIVGQKSSSGVQGQSPVGGLGMKSPRSWSKMLYYCTNFNVFYCINFRI